MQSYPPISWAMKRRGGPDHQKSERGSVFKQAKKSASTAAPSRTAHEKGGKLKNNEQPKKDAFEYEDDLLDGDTFYEAAIDKRKSRPNDDTSDSESIDENPEEIKLRQGKAYLERIMQQDSEESEGSDEDEDATMARLASDALIATGALPQREMADKVKAKKGKQDEIRVLRGHKLPVTAVRISDDETTIYSASKDCCIIKWDFATGKKVAVYKGKKGDKELGGHTNHIYALALSSDGKYLASGGKDKKILVWETDKNTSKDSFHGHRAAITALTFRLGSHDLYSGSDDRTVKLWNLDDMAFVDTLFGHKAEITAIDSLARERCVTSSLDKTVAIWKIPEEVHLEFLGPKSIQCAIAMITEDLFVSGGQDGNIQLWSSQKRRPLFETPAAHGPLTPESLNWITALAGLRYSDLFASGSGTGEALLWKINDDKTSFSLIRRIPLPGVINSLQFTKSGDYLIAGVGQEHRMGRWVRIPEARNGTHIIKLK